VLLLIEHAHIGSQTEFDDPSNQGELRTLLSGLDVKLDEIIDSLKGVHSKLDRHADSLREQSDTLRKQQSLLQQIDWSVGVSLFIMLAC
jgi:hypothetical protein